MSTISVRIPDSLHNRLRVLSKEEHISINQLISTALAEKLSAIDTEKYLKERAMRGNRDEYENILSKVKHRQPIEAEWS